MVITEHLTWPALISFYLSVLAITAFYGILLIFSAEQFPTVFTNSALGTSLPVGFCETGAIAPYLDDRTRGFHWLEESNQRPKQ